MELKEARRKLFEARRKSGLTDVFYMDQDADADSDFTFDDEGRAYWKGIKLPWFSEDIERITHRTPESGDPWIRIVFKDGNQFVIDRRYGLSLHTKDGNESKVYRSKGGVEHKLKELTKIKELGIENDEFIVLKGVLIAYNGSGKVVLIPEMTKEIAPSVFFENDEIEEVVFPSSLKLIGASAFEGCTHLKKVTFNNGLEEILDDAFAYCTSLKKISIPRSMQYIHNSVFEASGIRIVEGLENVREWVAPDAFYATDWYVNNEKKKMMKAIKEASE